MVEKENAMHARLWILAVGFVLAGMTAPAMAGWSSAGWYMAMTLDYGDGYGPEVFLGDGPYSSEADCKTAWSALSQSEQHSNGRCAYFASDPDEN